MPGWRAVLAGAISYAVASFVGAALVLLLLGTTSADFISFIAGATLLVMLFALIPLLVTLALLHAIRRTGWLAHTLAGLLAALAAQYIMSPGLLVRPAAVLDSWPLMLAGAAAGLVYWRLFTWLSAWFARPR